MFVFIILSVLTHSVLGQYECENFRDMPTRNISVRSSYAGVIESLHIYDIVDAEVEDSPYVDTIVENNYLTIRTTPDFADTEKGDNVLVTILIECVEGEYKLNYSIDVGEPKCEIEFEQPNYSYMFYDALPSTDEFDIPELEKIVVNCAISPVNFSIEENKYFAVEYVGINNDSNQYYARLKVLQNVYGPFDKTFNISVSDDMENPNRTATATLRVEVIDTNDVAFTRSSYYGHIKKNLDIVIENGPIILANSDIILNELQIEISPEYALFFEVAVSTEVNLVVRSPRYLTELAKDEDDVVVILTAYDSDNLGSDSDNLAETSVTLNITQLKGNYYDNDSTQTTPFETDDMDSLYTQSTAEEEVLQGTERSTTLLGFDDWASSMKGFVVMLVIITITLILSTIVYLKVRMSSSRRREVYFDT